MRLWSWAGSRSWPGAEILQESADLGDGIDDLGTMLGVPTVGPPENPEGDPVLPDHLRRER